MSSLLDAKKIAVQERHRFEIHKLKAKIKELETQHADDAEKVKFCRHEAYKHALRIINRPNNIMKCDIKQAVKTIEAIEKDSAALKEGKM